MNSFKRTLVFAFMGAFLISCQKYEEGPALSFRSKKQRVANVWEIDHATRNGKDVSKDYDQFELTLRDDYTALLKATYRSGDYTFIAETEGEWEFEKDKEQLRVDFDDNDFDNRYDIIKLKEKEMVIREVEDGTVLHFEPSK